MISYIRDRFFGLTPTGYSANSLPAVARIPPVDLDKHAVEIFERVREHTMTSLERVAALCNAVEYVVRANVPGSIVECGVWKGGSMMATALTLLRLGVADRDLYLFDTFEGMPAPVEVDRRFDGVPAAAILDSSDRATSHVWAVSSLPQVRESLGSIGYDPRKCHFIQGKVEDTLPTEAPQDISLLRLDTDWYESTYHELVHLFPRLSVGGVLIIDDYGYWQGARRAVDQYIREHNLPLLLNRIDETGRMAVKLSDKLVK